MKKKKSRKKSKRILNRVLLLILFSIFISGFAFYGTVKIFDSLTNIIHLKNNDLSTLNDEDLAATSGPDGPNEPNKEELFENTKIKAVIDSKKVYLKLKDFILEKYNDSVVLQKEQIGYKDKDSISINNTEYNDSRLTYTITGLKANTIYKVESYVKGEDVVNESNNTIGALLCSDGFDTSDTNNLGTFNWKKIRYVGKTDKKGELKIQFRLGFYFNLVKGKVYFDNLTISKYSDIKKYTSGKISLLIDKQDLMNKGHYYIKDSKIKKYVDNLYKTYKSFYDLTNKKPFSGKTIDIMFTNYSMFYGFAGNPIEINKEYSKEFFTNLNHNSWDIGFGIVHEISHTFDNENWNFEGEFWANTKMMYALDKNKFSVDVNGSGKLKGKEIMSYYKKAYDENLKKGIISYDGLTYVFGRIKEKYGWDIFKKTFKYFNSLTDYKGTRVEKFELFIKMLSEYSKKDIKSEFFTNTVWNTVINNLSSN